MLRIGQRASIVLLLGVLVSASSALGDVRIPFQEVQENVVPHPEGGDRPGTCSIVYYNVCGNRISLWTWGWGCIVGVVFDLPADCRKVFGESCANVDFWWYWRHTLPDYGYTVSYNLYRVDSTFCLIEPPVGTLSCQDPVERWNHYNGLGTTNDDFVALTASLDKGGLPWLATDNNLANQQAGCAPIPAEIHTFGFGNIYGPLCPPVAWSDDLGPVNVLMDARFSCEPTAVEHASWGSIKSLFR